MLPVLPLPKEWENFGEIPIGSSYPPFPPPPLTEKTFDTSTIQFTGRPPTYKSEDLQWQSEEEKDLPQKEEKQYSPPSSKIYQTKNVAYYKFYKVRPVHKYLNDNIYLAGGSLRTVLKCSSEEVNDFDLFFKSLDEVGPLYDRLIKDGWVCSYACPDGFLYSLKHGKHKIQLICEVEYPTVENLLNSFDISACIFAYHKGIFYFAREAVRSVFAKKLRVNRVSYPVATLKRLVKYANKGYSLGESAEDFCRLVSQGNIDSWDFRHYID